MRSAIIMIGRIISDHFGAGAMGSLRRSISGTDVAVIHASHQPRGKPAFTATLLSDADERRMPRVPFEPLPKLRQVLIVAFQDAEELRAGKQEHPRDMVALVVAPGQRDDTVRRAAENPATERSTRLVFATWCPHRGPVQRFAPSACGCVTARRPRSPFASPKAPEIGESPSASASTAGSPPSSVPLRPSPGTRLFA